MNMDPGPNGQKRPIEYSDQYNESKRQQLQPEIDLEALVAELNQQTQQPNAGGFDDSQSLEKQLEGALASLNAQTADQPIHQPGLQYPMHAAMPGGHYGQNQLVVPPKVNLELAGRSKEYESRLEEQLEGKITKSSVQKESALMEAKKRCLPILDSLACQILEYLSTGNYHDVLNVVGQPDSERGRAFRGVIDIFEQTKKMFIDGDDCPFIQYTHEFRDSRITIQRANLASWCAAVFGIIEIGFHDLDKWFMAAFVPEGNRLLKSQTTIYLELKTQAYISSLSQNQRSPETVLQDLFPDDIATKMLGNRADRQGLNSSETDFVNRCLKRRENIQGSTDQLELAKTYQWVFFLRDLTEYICKNHYVLLPHPAQQLRNAQLQKKQQQQMLLQKDEETPGGSTGTPGASQPATEKDAAGTSTGDKNAPVPVSSLAPGAHSSTEVDAAAAVASPRRIKAPRRELGEQAKQHLAQSNGKIGETDVVSLYTAAKATSEGMENSRPARTSVMTRRAWSKEEERALLEGLDKVQGPYWSQILELYGPGGSVSEILKDRNQVQLKDKARNLKMFFERCKMPVPAVFQYVTGNYATRKSSGKKSRDRRKAEERSSPVPGSSGLNLNRDTAGRMPPPQMRNDIRAPVLAQPDEDVQQSAEALDKALSMLKGTDDNFQHLIQSVGDYINNQ